MGDSWVSQMLTLKKGLEFSRKAKTTLLLPQLEDRQEALSWDTIQKNPFQSYQTWTFWPNHALKDRGSQGKRTQKTSTYQSCRARLGQTRERALWSSSAVSHIQCKLGVSVQHATVFCFCFVLQKRTPNRSSSFPFVHLCLNSKGLVKLVSKDVS